MYLRAYVVAALMLLCAVPAMAQTYSRIVYLNINPSVCGANTLYVNRVSGVLFVRVAGTCASVGVASNITTNGASGTPALKLSGTIFTGGGTANTKPQFLVEPAGTTSTAWDTNGTLIGANGPSGFAGNLLDLQVNGASKFRVSNTGTVTANSSILAGTGLWLGWTGRSLIGSASNGVIQLNDSNGTDFNRLQFGGTTNAFPAIKRNGTALNFRLADDSADAPITTAGITSSGIVSATSGYQTTAGYYMTGGAGLWGGIYPANATTTIVFPATKGLIWSSTADGTSGSYDTGMHRSSAGLAEINNGTPGTLRDLRTRNIKVTATTVSALPTCNAGAEGTMAAVTDATAPTYLGTLTGGGAVHAPAYCNGTAWVSH